MSISAHRKLLAGKTNVFVLFFSRAGVNTELKIQLSADMHRFGDFVDRVSVRLHRSLA